MLQKVPGMNKANWKCEEFVREREKERVPPEKKENTRSRVLTSHIQKLHVVSLLDRKDKDTFN